MKRAGLVVAQVLTAMTVTAGLLEDAGITVHGFADIRAGTRTQDDPYQRDTSLAEARLQLQIERPGDYVSIHTRTDILHDDIPGMTSLDIEKGTGALDLREAYILLTVFQSADIKLGRQIMTWGTGDLLFINDLFPKDWQAFFTGRDTDYLKAPSDAMFVSFFPSAFSIDLIYTPRFDPDRYISGDRISYWNPSLGRRAGNDAVANPELPDKWLEDDEIAARVYGNLADTETAVYIYDGYWKSPSGFNPESGRASFPELSVFGASARRGLGEGLVNVEAGYYDSRQDGDGTDPFVPNSEIRFLAGYEREISRNLTMSLQYYLEHMLDYDDYKLGLAEGQPARDEDRHVTTIRLVKRALNQNLTLSFFAYYSPSDKDAYMRPTAAYNISDAWTVSAGANIFTGEDPHTFFAQFENNSNVYGSLRYSF
jgi:hypothetical protein